MKIEIEFEMYQEVYFMKDDKVSSDDIEAIRIDILRKGGFATDTIKTVVNYTTLKNGAFKPGKVFATKQDLLDSL